MIIFLFLTCFTVFFSLEVLIGYLKTFPLEMGGQVVKNTYAMGVVASVYVRTIGRERRGQILPFWCVRTNWIYTLIKTRILAT